MLKSGPRWLQWLFSWTIPFRRNKAPRFEWKIASWVDESNWCNYREIAHSFVHFRSDAVIDTRLIHYVQFTGPADVLYTFGKNVSLVKLNTFTTKIRKRLCPDQSHIFEFKKLFALMRKARGAHINIFNFHTLPFRLVNVNRKMCNSTRSDHLLLTPPESITYRQWCLWSLWSSESKVLWRVIIS